MDMDKEDRRMNWIRAGKTVSESGTTNIYAAAGTGWTIESRKRHIPHAGGRSGTWDCTTYFVLRDGIELAEKWSLRDAKEFAEELQQSCD